MLSASRLHQQNLREEIEEIEVILKDYNGEAFIAKGKCFSLLPQPHNSPRKEDSLGIG